MTKSNNHRPPMVRGRVIFPDWLKSSFKIAKMKEKSVYFKKNFCLESTILESEPFSCYWFVIFKAACGRSADRIPLEPSSKKNSDGNAETNGFAILAKLKYVDFDSVAETFRDASDRYSGHLITCT